jgi:hypothetical protein
MMLADYALNWLETYKKGKIRPSSYERYQFCLQLLCKDELAHMDVRAIRLEDVQMYINRLDAMSASTVKKQKLLLSQGVRARGADRCHRAQPRAGRADATPVAQHQGGLSL